MTQGKSALEFLAILRRQFTKEEATKEAMLDILEAGKFDEEDIPQNSDLGVSLKALVQDGNNLFAVAQTLELDVLECGEYICFKVDDASGTEDIYFISPTEVLYLESGCLSIF